MTRRVALITGAARGIGAGIGDRLGAAGHHVVVTDLDLQACAAQAERIRAAGGGASAWAMDVTDETCVEDVVERVVDQVGPIGILINNAGITRDTTFHRMSALQWQEVINTNLNSCFNVTRPVIDGMRERKWGRIIQISSINGQKGQYGQANYAASKAGMHGFTISLAQENARFGITVNTVSPGYIATDMVMAVPEEVRAKIVVNIPTGRLGTPEEIAYAVSFFMPDEAAWITGANLSVNGGHYMGW